MTNLQVSVSEHPADELDVKAEVEKLQSVGEDLLRMAKAKGASQVEVGVSKDIGLSVQVRNQQVDTLEYNRDNSFGLTVYFGHKKGIATTSDLTIEALSETVDAACNIARHTQEDPCSGLADAELMATQPVELELDCPMGVTAEIAKEYALACEAEGLNADARVEQSEGATFSSHRNIRFYANSHGFSAAVPSSRHSLSCVLIAQDEQGMQRDFWYSITRDAEQLETAKSIGEKAAKRAVSRLGGRKIATQKLPVVVTPEIARGLVGNFCAAIRGASLYRRSSFLLDQLNQPVFPEFVDMQEKPFLKKGLASSWFDNEGIATREQAIIKQGVLQTYLLNSYSARRLEMSPTGHAGGLHNLHIEPGNANNQNLSFDELVKQMHKGLIVTEVMGHGVNLVNGDYSRGASGFWVENGEIQHFVEEITIAGNLKQMFAGLQAIGTDLDYRSSTVTGSWLLSDMMIAGN
ncbi:metalloprotease PmbA [Aliikangiella coralliicola]|uniref:Metalloprotease PmbA n=1 Tax=Aliikangiella coralliicola TaxID=2592383 RepID=A0A545UB13_9GAMM|nr:metalloprotease PmbA [Aliikangiella coralliicola]TQV86662.1 metalloprotease PmbA [Aliikangiella coralliicola]